MTAHERPHVIFEQAQILKSRKTTTEEFALQPMKRKKRRPSLKSRIDNFRNSIFKVVSQLFSQLKQTKYTSQNREDSSERES